MSRRTVCGVTAKCSASASIETKPRWRTRSMICCCRAFCGIGRASRGPILSGWQAFASQHRGRRRCSRVKRLALDEGGRLPGSSGPTKSRQRGGVMASGRSILAIDQGTTSTRAILFDQAGKALASAQRELPQIFPADGWVEHDPEEIWRATLAVCREAIAGAGQRPGDLAALGISNQRETTLLWERATGRPLYNAIVWQDRRGAPLSRRLVEQGLGPVVQRKTGLLIDSYFSATKIAWILDNVGGARAAAERGELAFGTVDSFLLWRLTGGRVHATDATNASRTMLYDITRQDWDEELLAALALPPSVLPAGAGQDAGFRHAAFRLLR